MSGHQDTSGFAGVCLILEILYFIAAALAIRVFVIDFEEVFRFAAFIIWGREFALVMGSLENNSFCFGGNIARSFFVV